MPMLCIEEGPLRGVECEVPEGGHVVAGRSRQCELPLRDEQASRMHFRADFINGELRITDLESQNGTWVNGKKISATAVAGIGAKLKAGRTLIRVREGSRGYLTGTELAGYRLQQRLGGGGMGEVYKATQMSLGRTVAVKVLSEDLAKDRSFVKRFIAEARAAGKLSHPNVVQVYDVGDDEGRYFISMEYVESGSVEDLLEVEEKLAPSRALEIGLQTARALEYAERQEIVHCDVKPDNLLLTADGEVRLSDLGIAKRAGESAAGDDEGVFGSPHYMSPEQARGEQLDHRSDLYSLGATLFRILTGRTLFTGDRSRKVMEKQVFEKPDPVRDVNPGVPRALADIVEKLVQKDPDDRYQSAGDLVRDLKRAATSATRAEAPGAKLPGKKASGAKAAKPPPAMTKVRRVRPRGRLSSRTASLIKMCVAIAGLAVFGVFLAKYLGRGAKAFERARKLEEAGRLEDAVLAYREVLQIEPPASLLAAKARARIEAIDETAGLVSERARCLEIVRAAEAESKDGGGALARAVGKLQALSKTSGVGLEVASGPLETLRKRLNDEAASELRSMREKAGALVSKKRYGDAARLFSQYPSYYRGLPASEGVDDEGPRIEEQARSDWAAARARVSGLMEDVGRRTEALEEARNILIPFARRTGIDKIESEAKALREQVEARARDVAQAADDAATKARMAEADTIAARALLLEHGYHFDKARTLLRRAESIYRLLGKGARADEIERKIKAITRPEIRFEMLLRKIAERKLGQHTVSVPGGPVGRVVGARKESTEFTVRADSGAGGSVKWDRLPPGEIIKLFRAMAPTPDDRLVIAGFALDHGLAAEAKKELMYASRVRSENAPLARLLKFRAQVGTPIRPDEKDAKTLADLALSEVAEGRVDAAREHLELLKTRYAGTAAAKTKVDEIAAAIAEANP